MSSLLLTYVASAEGTASSPADDPASHKNEGFLKSMWHILTNHPAHSKTDIPNPDSPKDPKASDSGSKSKDTKAKKGDQQEK